MRRDRMPWGRLLRGILLPVVVVLVLVAFSTALSGIDSGRAEEDRQQLVEALQRGCLACYAAEGVYPPTLDYLKEQYGVQIDETRYTVVYSAFSENLMPDITVLERAS